MTDRRPAADGSSPARSGQLDQIRALTEQARIAFEAAREAFLRLEMAHQEGRPGSEENAAFQVKVTGFKKAADAVHRAAMEQRENRPNPANP